MVFNWPVPVLYLYTGKMSTFQHYKYPDDSLLVFLNYLCCDIYVSFV